MSKVNKVTENSRDAVKTVTNHYNTKAEEPHEGLEPDGQRGFENERERERGAAGRGGENGEGEGKGETPRNKLFFEKQEINISSEAKDQSSRDSEKARQWNKGVVPIIGCAAKGGRTTPTVFAGHTRVRRKSVCCRARGSAQRSAAQREIKERKMNETDRQ